MFEVLVELLDWLDRSNVGKSAKGKGTGQTVGKAGVKPELHQQLN